MSDAGKENDYSLYDANSLSSVSFEQLQFVYLIANILAAGNYLK